MHELAIADQIVQIVEAELRRRGNPSVEAVHLDLGVMSGVDPDALLFCYDVAIIGTPLANAKLKINRIPAVAHCERCNGQVELKPDFSFLCPFCQCPVTEIVHGKEIEVAYVEIRDEPAHSGNS